MEDVLVRLGGFHLLMSFLGCIGYIMAGSGLKELLTLIYAPNSLKKILSWHSYARAVRAHMLVQVVLAERIFSVIEFSDVDEETIKLLLGSDEEFVSIETINSSDGMRKIFQKFENALLKLSNRGAMAKLGIQYFKMVNLMKNFIAAERMGDWNQHIKSVRTMNPLFPLCRSLPICKGCPFISTGSDALKGDSE